MEIGKKMCYTNNEEKDKLIKWSKAFMSTSYEELNQVLKTILTKSSKEQLLSEVLRLSGDDKMKKKLGEKTKLQMEHESFLHYFEELEKELNNKKEELDSQKEELDNQKEELYNQKEELYNQKEQLNNEKEKIDKELQEVHNEKQQLDNIILNKQQEKTIEIAKKMLKENCDIEFITGITGLSIEDILKL